MVNNKKLIITILLKKEFIKKELPCYYNILCKYQNKSYYYYNIPNSRKIIKSNMKIQKVNKMLLENMLALDSNLYKKIKNIKNKKISSNINNKSRKYKLIKNKCNMLLTPNKKISYETLQKININTQQQQQPQPQQQPEIKNEIMKTEPPHTRNLSSSTIIPDFDENKKVFHYRSKSVTFVKDSLEQIRLFNIFDPPNNITMTPTHYSTGKINSNSLIRFHRRNRNDDFQIVPFTPSELKKNALYDHPVRRHRSNSKHNMPYNLKMDFSFGDPISPSPMSSPKSSVTSSPSTPLPYEKNTISNYKISDDNSLKDMDITYEIPKSKSPVLSNKCNYTMESTFNFVNNKEGLYNPTLLSVSQHKVTSLPQIV